MTTMLKAASRLSMNDVGVYVGVIVSRFSIFASKVTGFFFYLLILQMCYVFHITFGVQ